MNTTSVNCKRVTVPVANNFKVEDGMFGWGPESADGDRTIYIRIPGTGASGFDALHVRRGPDRGIEREWSWDGNEDMPTLSPSIHSPGEWHGHLRNGRLESC